jgi:hypothetical protein
MKTLKRIAIVAVAGFGALAMAQAQEYTNKLNEARPRLDRLMQSMQYAEVIATVRETVPAGVPDFPQDPANPQVTVTNFYEMDSIQDFRDYLYRALLMSGDTEGAIACIKTTEEVAKKSAADTEAGLAPAIGSQTAAIDGIAKNLDRAAPAREEIAANKAGLEAEKGRLESMGNKRKKADNLRLEAVGAELAAAETELASLDRDMALWRNNAQAAAAMAGQLNGFVGAAKQSAAKFAPVIEKMEGDLAAEKDAIDSKHKGSKAKYVAAALPGASAAEDKKERVRLLNRLLFLDPKNAAVKKQRDAAVK